MMPGTNIIKQINKTPSSSYFNAHYFCDYIELLALLNNTDIVSISDIYDRFLEDEKIQDIGSEDGAESDDKWNSRIGEWYILLDIRQQEFGDLYPFTVTQNTIQLKNDIDDKKNYYIFLLLSSTRKYIQDSNLLTTDFKRASFDVLTNYLPGFSKIFQFGKSNIEHDRYEGHITNKIDTLAQDLNCTPKYKPSFFAPTNNGDGGLDLVAWVPFNNDTNKGNIQIYLGQCATGKDWLNKQDDTHKFPNKYITFEGDINYLMFIPYDGRNEDRTFNEEAQMGNYLLFDRFRLLNMVNDYSSIQNIPSFDSIIQKVIAFEEDIV